MTICAEEQRRWLIRGHYLNGAPVRFTVLAFDHAEAQAKAAAKTKATLTDCVLCAPGRFHP